MIEVEHRPRRNGSCPCDTCRQARNQYVRDLNAARRARRILLGGRLFAPDAREHGTITAYSSWGCRCLPCTRANRVAQREYQRKRRAS